MNKINQKKIYIMNLYAPIPNTKFIYKDNPNRKEIIKAFVKENQMYKIGTILVKQVKRNEFHEIITDIPIPIYKIEDDTIIDEYNYSHNYHREKPTESAMFGIAKEKKEYEINKILGLRKEKKVYEKISLKEANSEEFKEYVLNNDPKTYLKGIKEIYKQAEKNLRSTNFIKEKKKRYH